MASFQEEAKNNGSISENLNLQANARDGDKPSERQRAMSKNTNDTDSQIVLTKSPTRAFTQVGSHPIFVPQASFIPLAARKVPRLGLNTAFSQIRPNAPRLDLL